MDESCMIFVFVFLKLLEGLMGISVAMVVLCLFFEIL